MKKFSDFVDKPLNENLLGKTYSFVQFRKHEQQKAKATSIANRIQEKCRNGIQTDDVEKKLNLLLSSIFDLATALKIQSEMSSAIAGIEASNSLLAQNVKKEVEAAFQRQKDKR